MYLNGGTFLSTNGGVTFQRVDIFQCTDIVVDSTVGTTFYRASLPRGIYESQDKGVTWKLITPPSLVDPKSYNTAVQNIRMAVRSRPDGTKVLYAGFLAGQPLAIVRGDYNPTTASWTWGNMTFPYTVDNGTVNGLNPIEDEDDSDEDGEMVFEGEEAGSQGYLHFSIGVDPVDWNVVYVGGDRQPTGANYTWPNSIGARDYTGRLFRGRYDQPGDQQWVPLTHMYADNSSSPHADSRHMAWDADGQLIESDDGGVYRRVAPQTTTGIWQSVNGNLQVLEGHSVSYLHPMMFVTGNQDTGSTFGPANGPWSTLTRGDGSVVQTFFNGTHNIVCTPTELHTVAFFMFPNFCFFQTRAISSSPTLSDQSSINRENYLRVSARI
jgi:hypothetical protein